MTQEGQISPPPVLWVQRKDIVFVTICLEDCKEPTLKIDSDKIYFKGIGGTDRKLHEVTINLYKEINLEKTLKSAKGRNIEILLTKKEEGQYWPRLTKEQQKFHWLKTDFNKWEDEDESDEEGVDGGGGGGGGGGGRGLAEMMRQMGGLSGSGDIKPNFEDLDMGDDVHEPDSDDESMPDLLDEAAVRSEKEQPRVQS